MKKGFTLIEVLAVISIAAVICLLTLPKILNQINGTKKELSDSMKKIVYSASSLYAVDNHLNKVNGNHYCVTLQKLVDDDYLNKNLSDPVTNEKIDLNKSVQIEVSGNSFEYEIVSECIELVKDDDPNSPKIVSDSEHYVVVTPGTAIKAIDYFDVTPTSKTDPIVKTVCKADDNIITDTSSLALGEHNLECTVTDFNEKSSSASITLSVSNCFSFDSSTHSINDYYCYLGNTNGYQEISDVTIPYTINNIAVETINTEAFSEKQLTSVDFNKSTNLTTIGNKAFQYNNLSSVDLSNITNLTTIGNNAFQKLTKTGYSPTNQNLATIYTNGNTFDWGMIINGSSGYNFVTGTVINEIGDVTITTK